MIRVLIADDEAYFRSYMNTVIDWKEEGMQITASCKNASEVLAAVEETRIDIALLDINMPGLDGLSLAERLKEAVPDILIVFVTGYSEFDYAKRALRLGADDYLLKPFTKEELLAVLQKLKYKLQMERESRIREKKEHNVRLEEYLRRLVHSSSPDEGQEILSGLAELEFSFTGPYFCAAIIEMDDIASLRREQEDMNLWRFIVHNIASEILEGMQAKKIFFHDYEDQMVVLLDAAQPFQKQQLRMLFLSLQETMSRMMSQTLSIGVGKITDNSIMGNNAAAQIGSVYQDASRAAARRFITGPGSLTFYEDIDSAANRSEYFQADLYERMINALRRQAKDELRENMDSARHRLKESFVESEHIFGVLSGLLSGCFSYIREMKGNIGDIYGEHYKLYQNLYATSSMDDAFAYVTEIYLKAADAFSKTASHREKEIITAVRTYIAENYQDTELSAEKIAAGVFLDSSYVRRVISRQLDSTVTGLLTDFRMQKARELLAEGSNPVNQVAEMVGYLDPGYFSRCFRKYYGVSPRKYAQQVQTEE